MNKEMYLEDKDKKNMRRKPLAQPSPIEMPIQEMIDCIVRAGCVVTKSDSIGGVRLNRSFRFLCETAATTPMQAAGVFE
jgi:hypothetical protein